MELSPSWAEFVSTFKNTNEAYPSLSSSKIVLVSAGIELTVFLVAGTVLCFEFSM